MRKMVYLCFFGLSLMSCISRTNSSSDSSHGVSASVNVMYANDVFEKYSLKEEALWDEKGQRLHVNEILKAMNPSAPPPIEQWDLNKRQVILEHLESLLAITQRGLSAQIQAVHNHADAEQRGWDLDPEGKAARDVFQRAILLRFDYAQTYYRTHLALRCFIQRADQFGFDKSVVVERIDSWIHRQIKDHINEFADWDWNYASSYPLLKHRMAVLLSEAHRLNLHHPHLEKLGPLAYDDVLANFYEVIDLDLEQFPAQFIDGLTVLKYEAWADLLNWHISLGDQSSLTKGQNLWLDFLKRDPVGLDVSSAELNQQVG